MINVDLLRHICEIPGAPGYEQRVREFVMKELGSLVDDISVDNMGNVIAIKRGKSRKKVMIAAHMDEIGFMVNYIDDDGFLRFVPLGGFDPKTLSSQRVIVHGHEDVVGVMGSKPIHIMSPEERTKQVPLNEYFIDLGMTKKQAEQLVPIGAPVTRVGPLIEMGDCVNSKSLDNRVSVFILIEALRALENQEVPYDVYGVFTVQEEVGLRGAISSSHLIDPDFGLGLDVTIAFDVPGSNGHDAVTSLGKGAAIKILDGSTICDYRMINYLKKVATEHQIKWQPEILPKGGTDTAGLQRYGKKGAIAGAISIPLRHMHQTIELAHKEDIANCISLLTESLKAIDLYDWDFSNTGSSSKASDSFEGLF